MGHVLRMNDDRLVKQAVLLWYRKLEEENKTKKVPHRNTITYWRKLINEAGEDPNNIEHLITDRTKWRALVRNRVKHLEEYERQQGQNHVLQPDEIIRDRRESTKTPTENTLQCENCDKVCRSKAGLAIHRKRLHDSQQKETQCEKCGKTFTQEATLKNHMKKCLETSQEDLPSARKYVPKKGVCLRCDSLIALTNMSRHQATNKCKNLSLLKKTNGTDTDAARR